MPHHYEAIIIGAGHNGLTYGSRPGCVDGTGEKCSAGNLRRLRVGFCKRDVRLLTVHLALLP